MKHSKDIQVYDKKGRNIVDIKKAAWNALSPETQKAYTSDYKLFFEHIQKDVKDVTANDILEYIDHLRGNGNVNDTINRKIASLSKMFKIAVIAGEIRENPVAVLKEFQKITMKTSKEVRCTLSIKDVQKVTTPKKNDTIYTQQLICIIKTLAKTGLRISELTGIKNSDIYEHNKRTLLVRILGKGRKERFIYLEKVHHKEIKKLYPNVEGCDFLFYSSRHRRYCRKALWKRTSEFFQERIGKKFHPHMARHFFITYKISVEKQDIKSVSRYVGHQDTSTTLNMYVNTSLDVESSKVKI